MVYIFENTNKTYDLLLLLLLQLFLKFLNFLKRIVALIIPFNV